MSTYSTNLALELIGTGEQSGTWGVTTNTNLGTLLEQAISGYVTQAITDGADTTITIPNGATGVARNMFIEMTGALTAARNLIVPANKKLYFIYNNTTGGFAVTVKVSGLTGVSVPNGKKVILVSNGTDIVNAENYIASLSVGALTSGRVPYAGTSGLLQDSANLTFNGTTLTAAGFSGPISGVVTSTSITDSGLTSGRVTYASTGGLLIDSANLTFNGTTLTAAGFSGPISGVVTSTSITDSGLTSGRVTYATTGGLLTDSANLTFSGSALAVTGTLSATDAQIGYTGVNVPNGSNNQGLYIPTYNIGLAGVYSSINWPTTSASPSTSAWWMFGRAGSDNVTQLKIRRNTGVDVSAYIVNASGTDAAKIVDNHQWYTSGSQAMTLDSSGNVGIGTSSPSDAVTVGTTTTGKNIRIYSSSNGNNGLFRMFDSGGTERLQLNVNTTGEAVYYSPTSSVHAWYINTEQMRLTSTGLGIGTSSPAAKLHVNGTALFNGTTKVTGQAVEIQGDVALGNYSGYSTSNFREIVYSASTASFGNQPVANIKFQTTSDIGAAITFITRSSAGDYAERLRLDQVGNLGLGVTPSAWSTAYQAIQFPNGGSISGYKGSVAPILELSSNQYYDGAYKYVITGTATKYSQNQGVHSWYNAASGTAGNAITFTQAMTLDSSGNLLVGTTTTGSGGKLVVGGLVYQQQTANGTSGTPVLSGGYVIGPDNPNIYAGIRALNSYLSNNASQLAFYVTAAAGNAYEAGRFDSSGNLLVGTTSQASTSRFTVKAADTGYGGIGVVKSDSSDYWTQNIDSAVGYTWGKNGSDFWYAGRSGSNNCVSVNGSWVNSSDSRLKENIAPLSGALEKVCQLQGVSFDRISGGQHEIGLIAQDVEKIYPEAVEAPASEAEHYALNYGALVAPLIEAIKEQQAIIESLNARLTTLENK
jgi:hypothetical protein